MPAAAEPTVVVDGNNVIGAVPDGWWRDRPAAVRRLLGRLRCHAAAAGARAPVVLVLDVPQADLPEGDHGGVTVLYARRRGRDAADDRIADLVTGPDAALGAGPIEVVTSDRGLADRVGGRPGLTVTGARAYLARLTAAGC